MPTKIKIIISIRVSATKKSQEIKCPYRFHVQEGVMVLFNGIEALHPIS